MSSTNELERLRTDVDGLTARVEKLEGGGNAVWDEPIKSLFDIKDANDRVAELEGRLRTAKSTEDSLTDRVNNQHRNIKTLRNELRLARSARDRFLERLREVEAERDKANAECLKLDRLWKDALDDA